MKLSSLVLCILKQRILLLFMHLICVYFSLYLEVPLYRLLWTFFLCSYYQMIVFCIQENVLVSMIREKQIYCIEGEEDTKLLHLDISWSDCRHTLCSPRLVVVLLLRPTIQMVFLYSQTIKFCLSRLLNKHTQKRWGLLLLSALFVKLLVKCSFAAEPENISPWDVFIDPHFSFGLCSVPPKQCVPFQEETHCHFRPVEAISNAGLWQETSQDPFTSPLFKASKCLYTVCVYIQYVCMHLWALYVGIL